MDKKTAKVLTALVIPTVGVIGATSSVQVGAKVISSVVSNEQQEQLINYQQVINIDDAELRAMIKKTLSIPEHNDITLGDMHRLTELEIGYAYDGEVTSLKGLENAINLKRLVIRPQMIKDMSVIGGLTNLVELDLSGNDLSSIDFLASLTGLESLALSGTRISDISVLENLKQLKTLELEDNNISDISPLVDLTSLESLDVSNNVIETLPKFNKQMALKELNLSVNMELENISEVGELMTLETLLLNSTAITELDELSSLNNLKRLEFNRTFVNDLTPLKSLIGLEVVSGDETKVHDFRPIAHVKNISFHNLFLESIAEVTSEYVKIPVYGVNGELVPVISASHGAWDDSSKALKLTTAPIDGDVIEVVFGDNKNISGMLDITAVVEELATPIVLVDQNTGKVIIKGTSENAVVHYRESMDGEWKEYKGTFTATPASYSEGKANYYIEARQENFLSVSESAVNEFSMESRLSPVVYNFKWWTSGSAFITAKHIDESATIMYRFANGDWQRYTGEVNLTSQYQNGKIEMQFYAQSKEGESPITSFSILKAPTVEGVSGENKIKITHPLPKVNIYYRINGGEWLPYAGEFKFEKAGEYKIEAYVEEAGIESPISVPVVVKTSGQGGSSTADMESDDSSNNEAGSQSNGNSSQNNSTSGQSSSINGSKEEGSSQGQSESKNPETGVNTMAGMMLGGVSVLSGILMIIKRKK